MTDDITEPLISHVSGLSINLHTQFIEKHFLLVSVLKVPFIWDDRHTNNMNIIYKCIHMYEY
jgi:hypothetical protein